MILLNLHLASAIRGAAAGVALEESHHLLCLPKRSEESLNVCTLEGKKKSLYYLLNLVPCKSTSRLQSRLDWGMKPLKM